MGRSIKRNAVDADDESMRPVADIPGDADEGVDLPEISPELVLVDPELARLVRERAELPAASRPLLGPGLRLVPPAESNGETEPALEPPRAVPEARAAPAAPAIESAEPIVPRPTSPAEPSALQSADTLDATIVEVPPSTFESPTGTQEALAPAPERWVEAEPARVVEPERLPEPLPQAQPAQVEPERQALAAIAPAMPHPINRPGSTRPKHSSRPPRRGRGTIVFLAGVAVSSVAVLGILNLTGESSSSSPEATGFPTSGKPTKTEAPSSKAQASPAPKPKAATKPAPKPKATTTSKPKATTKPKAAVKPRATTKPRVVSTPKATTATKPKAAATPDAKAITGGAKTPAKPKAPAAPAPEPRRFAWAPVEGAVGYHVELFKGADRVLAKQTKEPVLELGQTWRYEGRVVRLSAGSYRWYVWPVTASGRATQAVVQAKLSIP